MTFTVIVCTVLIIHAIGVVQLVMVKEGKREGYSFSDSFGVLSFLLPISVSYTHLTLPKKA